MSRLRILPACIPLLVTHCASKSVQPRYDFGHLKTDSSPAAPLGGRHVFQHPYLIGAATQRSSNPVSWRRFPRPPGNARSKGAGTLP